MPWNEVMPKFETGTLNSSSGQKVTDKDQALAIMLSEKRAAAHGKKEYAASGSRGERAMRRAMARRG
jgi:hypothetical protein